MNDLRRAAVELYGKDDDYVIERVNSERLRYREDRKSWEPILDVRVTANGVRYDSVLDFMMRVLAVKVGEISFHNPRKFGNWGFVRPIKRLRFMGAGQGYAFIIDGDLDLRKWALEKPRSVEALVRVYPTRWVALRGIKEEASDVEGVTVSLWSFSTFLQEMRKQRFLPFEMRLVILTKAGCFGYTIDVLNGKVLDDPRNGKIPTTSRVERNLQECLLFERIMAENMLPDKLRIVLLAAFETKGVGIPEVMHLLNTSPRNAENILLALKSRGLVEEQEGPYGKVYRVTERCLRRHHSRS